MNSLLTWPCAALSRAPLADKTTMRVGGRAEWLLEPANPEELARAWSAARERGYLPRVLGGGANLVIDGGELAGVVLSTARLRYILRTSMDEDPRGEWSLRESPARSLDTPRASEDTRLVAWCGATIPGLVSAATQLGWSGLEGLAGVPGQVGGGVAMNAGGRWGDFWDVVESVRVLDMQTGDVRDLARAQCSPKYRDGGMRGLVVLGAVVRLEKSEKETVRARVREYLEIKRKVQPVTESSAGCIFKNPDPALSAGRSAGKLIEEAGGKSLARGGAIVSPLHGNFIVNTGTATPADVFTLIEDVRDLVREKTGIQLATEVKMWRATDPVRG
ncbi:MAG TPA: FAD-binding protein [Planctomycetota bacterium]|nr:FAD-binding protein [Planctomycetota bacterium]